MADDCRDLLHALFADAHFQHEEQPVINAPDDVVPACAVPESGAEPDQEQTADLPALSEQRHIQQIIPEKSPQGNMPPLPELRDILAQERVAEVFVQVESENACNTDCHIRIAGKVKVHLQGIQHNAVPHAQGGL